jgi:hypothetical protein
MIKSNACDGEGLYPTRKTASNNDMMIPMVMIFEYALDLDITEYKVSREEELLLFTNSSHPESCCRFPCNCYNDHGRMRLPN